MLSPHERSRPERRGLNGKITVLVASAVAERRNRWESRLQESFAFCEVAERRALEQIVRHLEPDILLLDLCLPGLGGVRQISRIQPLSPRTKIIVLSTKPDDREALTALELGARGYYSRDIDAGQLRKAVEGVQAGEVWIQRRLVTVLLEALRSMKRPPRKGSVGVASPITSLTPREYQVAELITAGARNKEIARQLNITERTVKAHLTELFRTFRVTDRLRLAVLLNHEGMRPTAMRGAQAVAQGGMAPAQNGRISNGFHDARLADQSPAALGG